MSRAAAGSGNRTRVQHFAHHLPRLGAGAVAAVQAKRLHDLVPHGVEGRERGHRLLEDDGDPAAPEGAVRGRMGVEAREVERRLAKAPFRVGEQDVPAGDVGALREDPEHGLGDDRLARARFADEGDRAAGRDVERHPLHRPHRPLLAKPELHLEVTDGEEGGRPGALRPAPRGLSKGRLIHPGSRPPGSGRRGTLRPAARRRPAPPPRSSPA